MAGGAWSGAAAVEVAPPKLDRTNPAIWNALVAQVGGVDHAAQIARIKPQTVRRYLHGGEGNVPSGWHVNMLAKYVREHLGAVPGVLPGNVPVSGRASGTAPQVPKAPGRVVDDRPRGFTSSASDMEQLIDEDAPAESGNLSFFPRPPKLSGFRPKAPKLRGDATPLSNAEANEYYQLLCDMLPILAEFADHAITRTTVGHPEVLIWNDLEDDEIEILADAIIAPARQYAAAAQVVRTIGWAWRRVQVGIITIPRFIKTLDNYAEYGFTLDGVLPMSLLRQLSPRRPRGPQGPQGGPR